MRIFVPLCFQVGPLTVASLKTRRPQFLHANFFIILLRMPVPKPDQRDGDRRR